MSSVPSQSAQPAPPNSIARVHHWASRRNIFLLLLLAFLLFTRFAGSLLVRDRPEKSDVIVVLAGDSQVEGFLDHDVLKPESIEADVAAFFSDIDEARRDSLVAFGWAMAEDLASHAVGR